MESALFLASLIAIGLVMWWVIVTERAGRGNAADTGLFAMRSPPTPRKAADRRTTPRS